jgi:hypothetical protein
MLVINAKKLRNISLKLSTPCILAVSFLILFQPNTRNMLNSYVYHLLFPTCFGVRYAFFRENTVLMIKKYMLSAMLLHSL